MSPEYPQFNYNPGYDPSILVARREAPKKSLWEKMKKPLGILSVGAVLGAGIGAVDGARRGLAFDGGEITSETTAEVKINKAATEELLCAAYGEGTVSLSRSYRMDPLGDIGTKMGLFAKKTIYGKELPRRADYCLEPQAFEYAFYPDRLLQRNGGTPEKKAIVAEINLDQLITLVSRPRDIRRDSYDEETEGAFAPLMSAVAAFLKDKDIKNLLKMVPGATDDPDPETQLENVMTGSLDADADELMATRCLEAGKEFDFSQPTVMDVIRVGFSKAVLNAFRRQHPDSPQPDLKDVEMKIVNGVQLSDKVEVKDGATEEFKNTIKNVEETPPEVPIQAGPATINIKLSLEPVEKQPVNCKVSPGAIESSVMEASTQPTTEANR